MQDCTHNEQCTHSHFDSLEYPRDQNQYRLGYEVNVHHRRVVASIQVLIPLFAIFQLNRIDHTVGVLECPQQT